MKKLWISLCMAAAIGCSIAAVACNDVEHTVTFEAGYGLFDDDTALRSLIVGDGKAVKEQTVSRDGWKFEHWALDGEEYNFSKKVKGDITLKAVWTPVDFYEVSFETVTGATFHYSCDEYQITDLKNVPCVNLQITVELDAFYAGAPIVVANDTNYTATDGVYTVPVTQDTVITAVGVRDDVSQMAGLGILGDPYIVARPIDLIKIAEEVNKGNEAYSLAHYELGADIDLKGHELNVIGDGRDLNADGTEYAFFGGNFNGAGHTIKNFVINTNNCSWVGLFGMVMAGASPTANASIYHLNLDNYEINASVSGMPVYCGSFVGQGVGANVFVCGATNGTINVSAAADYFSYVGGVMGYQYSVYAPEYDASYVSAISYATVNTEIYANSGLIYSAGGIAGYVVADDKIAPSYINHSYTDSTITGAILSGGIAGYLGQYTGIVDCYSTGDVLAMTSDIIDVEEFNHVYAGGIAAYAENYTVIAESFAVGLVDAYSNKGSSFEHKGGIVGGFDGADTLELGATKTVVYNCYYANGGVDGSVNLLSADFIKNNLNWKDYDWVIVDGQYPTVNLEETSISFAITVEFGAGNTVDTYTKNVIRITDIYLPLGLWIVNGDINSSFTADTTGKIAIGYYFDEDFTIPVPYSYVPTRDLTLYVNFADYSEIAGTYYLKNAYKPELVQLTLNADGTFIYTDGNKTSTSTYVYDGKTVLFNDARFARYACVYENSLDPYVLKNYRAKVNASGELEIFDNSFYTETAPLIASKTSPIVGEYFSKTSDKATYYNFYSNGKLVYWTEGERETQTSYTCENGTIKVNGNPFATYANGEIVLVSDDQTLVKFDAFHGEWTFSLLSEEKITFNSVDKTWTWNSAINAEKLSGTYEIVDGKAVLYKESTQLCTLAINDGFIEHLGVSYYQNGLAGTWQDYYYGVTLTLDGVGGGSMIYENALQEITYVQESHRDNFYTIYNNDELFAYLQYNAQGKYLDVVFNILDNSENSVQGLKMWRYDEFNGEWISSKAGFETVSFNGYGEYNTVYTVGEHSTPIKGELTIDGNKVAYSNTGNFKATFTYNSVSYTLTFLPESNTLNVESNSESFVLVRHDQMNGVTLFNEATGAEISFNGRSSVNDGVATYKDNNGTTEYDYTILGNLISLSNGTTTFYLEENDYYVVKNESMQETGETYSVKTVFTGNWAISNAYALLTIGGETIADDMEDIQIKGTYLGKAVTFTKLSDVKLSFVTETGKKVYVFALDGGDIAISPDPEIYFGTYTFCAKVDEMFGEWKKESGPFVLTLSFDGMNDSNYAYARAIITNRGTSVEYYYMMAENGDIILSSINPINDVYYNYKVVWCIGEDPLAYSNGEKSFRLVQIDSLYGKTLEFGGVEYTFDGVGTVVTANGSHEYEIVSYSDDGSTVTVLLDGKTEITFPVND